LGGATAKQHQTHPKEMTKMVKKCSIGQSCIQKVVTSYKIHTLVIVFPCPWTLSQILLICQDFDPHPHNKGAPRSKILSIHNT
jgi:hypothetical protein